MGRTGSHQELRRSSRRSFPIPLTLVPALLLGFWVHAPVLGSFLFADDYLHLYLWEIDSLPEFLVRTHGGHALAAWRASFWLQRSLFGMHFELWFASILALHLLNVALFYGIAEGLTGRPRVAGAGAALFALSPLARGALGWISVHGSVLLATFTLWALYEVVRVARSGEAPGPGSLIRWSLLMLLAANSFGLGLGLAMAFPFACVLLLWQRRSRGMLWLFVLVPLVPLLYFGTGWLAAQMPRGSGIWSATRQLDWHRIPSYLELLRSLVVYAFASFSLPPLLAVPTFRGEAGEASRTAGFALGMARPLFRAFTLALLLGFGIRMLRATAPVRRQALALLLLLLACYAPLALGREWMSAFWGDLVWANPRYHYPGLALAGLTLCVLAPPLSGRLAQRKRGVALAAAGFVVWFAISAAASSRYYAPRNADEGRALVARTLARIREQVLATPIGGTAYLPLRRFPGHVGSHFPGEAALFAIHHPDNELEGRSVRFVAPIPGDLRIFERFADERVRELLVTPREARGLPERGRARGRGAR